MPGNVSLRHRATVTAGFANEVEAVNQYAAVMYAPTANGTALDRSREQPQITAIRPNVATNSLKCCAVPLRVCRETEIIGSWNIRCAVIAPLIPPNSCAAT